MKIKLLIILLLFSAMISYVFIVQGKEESLKDEELLKLGEDMYLKLLWMVKGAFEDRKLIVNNRELDDNEKIFTCSNTQNDCIGNKFEETFYQVFSRNISYEKVYGDGITYSWVKKNNNEYHFLYNFNCQDNNLEDNYQLILKEYSDDEIAYEISSLNFSKVLTRTMTLVKEDNVWKISQAVYRDKCMMDYYIS